MWEEEPWYQKQQAKKIGLTVLGLFALYLGWAVVHRDWDLLKGTLVAGGCLIAALGLLVGLVWVLVKVFTRSSSKQPRRNEPPVE